MGYQTAWSDTMKQVEKSLMEASKKANSEETSVNEKIRLHGSVDAMLDIISYMKTLEKNEKLCIHQEAVIHGDDGEMYCPNCNKMFYDNSI